jgi:transposase
MKDGRTHLAYKAENTIDLDTDIVVGADVYPADRGDTDTLMESVVHTQKNLLDSESEAAIKNVVADKGYNSAKILRDLEVLGLRGYIPEREQKGKRRWTDKPDGHKDAVYGNRRRMKGSRNKALQRKRSELVERSFAHVCETGGGRRTWLRGLVATTKRYLIQVAARNLGTIMRKLFGVGTARSLQDSFGSDDAATNASWAHLALVLMTIDRIGEFPSAEVTASRLEFAA